MKSKWGSLLLTMGAALCLMAFRGQATPPDLSSPKATVRSFLNAMKSQDVAAIQQCIKGATSQEFLKQFFTSPSAPQIVSVNSLVEETANNNTHVAAEFTMRVAASSQPNAKLVPVTVVDMFSLEKQGQTWLLVPDPAFTNVSANLEYDSIGKLIELRPLSFVVAISGSPQLVAPILQAAHARAQAVSCLSNAKQIVIGTLMYVQDYDEITPRKGPSYTELIWPYVKNRQIFTCPLDPSGTISYTFNSSVAGISLADIPFPDKTVMIYEGKASKLDYRHVGHAIIGFMDGHCKMIRPEEEASLIWIVKVPRAVKPAPKRRGHK
jgi:hypothetical protein